MSTWSQLYVRFRLFLSFLSQVLYPACWGLVLARFHAAGYCHRDVTPKNLLITTSGEGAIVDCAWADFDLVGRLPERCGDPFSTRTLAEKLGRPLAPSSRTVAAGSSSGR